MGVMVRVVLALRVTIVLKVRRIRKDVSQAHSITRLENHPVNPAVLDSIVTETPLYVTKPAQKDTTALKERNTVCNFHVLADISVTRHTELILGWCICCCSVLPLVSFSDSVKF